MLRCMMTSTLHNDDDVIMYYRLSCYVINAQPVHAYNVAMSLKPLLYYQNLVCNIPALNVQLHPLCAGIVHMERLRVEQKTAHGVQDEREYLVTDKLTKRSARGLQLIHPAITYRQTIPRNCTCSTIPAPTIASVPAP